MSLASSTLKDDLKTIHTNHPGVVILAQGPNPPNTRQSLDSITMYASTHSLDHFLHPAFNTAASSHNTSNKLQILLTMEKATATAAAAASAAAAAGAGGGFPPLSPTPSRRATSSSSSSSSHTPPHTPRASAPTDTQSAWGGTTIKREYGPLAGDDTSKGIVSYSAQGARTTTVAESAVYFTDPLDVNNPGIAEPPEQRRERLRMWAFVSAVCYHHAHLLSGLRVGDIAGIIAAIYKFGMSFGSHDTLDGVTAMATLEKKGKTWQDFVTTVANIRSVLDRETNPRWKIGDLLLPGYILRAMEADPKFDVELTLLRRTHPPPDVDHIMATLSTKARELSKNSKKPLQLAAYAGGPPPATPTHVQPPTSGKELCRKFQLSGECRYDRPSMGRWCKHSHGKDNDIKRMAAKRAYKPPAPSPAATPAAAKHKTAQPASGCFRCGSKLHGIDNCTEEVKANVADTLPNTPLPGLTLDTMATAFAMAMGKQRDAAADQVAGMTADPLGVGPNNVADTLGVSALDHELAKLFNTKR